VPVVYSKLAMDYRLAAVVTAIDGGGSNGSMALYSGSTVISTISLSRPSAVINGGVLTFSGTLVDPSASGTGYVDSVVINDSNGSTIVSGLTVGIPGDSTDVIISNGLSSTLITAGKVVQVLSAQILGG
jgi:hypothetical protein